MSHKLEKKRVPLTDGRTASEAAQKPLPQVTVAGANFFSGPFISRGGESGVISMTDDNWRQMWRQLGQTPPGPLPKGAVAIMHAGYRAGDPWEYLPEHMTHDGKEITIHWNRRHLKTDEDETELSSRYAVLVLPNARIAQQYRDSFLQDDVNRRRALKEQMEAERAIITDGTKKDVPAMPAIRIRKKPPSL